MKLRGIFSTGRMLRRLRSVDATLRDAALDAAAEALHDALADISGKETFVHARRARRSVGSHDSADVAREFGTLSQPPSPWLAPALPLALEPMRAAARTRVRETIASRAGDKSAAARAASPSVHRKK